MSVFNCMLVLNSSSDVDVDLLEYAALLASANPGSIIVIASYPSDAVLRSLAPAARGVFRARRLASPVCRLIVDPHMEAVLDVAREIQADLIVARYRKASAMADFLISESPCSLCLVPGGRYTSISRPLVGVDLDATAATILERACHLARSLNSDELFVVHSCFRHTLNAETESAKRFRYERTLEIYRFLARTKLHGVNCTPLLEESLVPWVAIARSAAQHDADLIITGCDDPPTEDPGVKPAQTVLEYCRKPLLQIRLTDSQSGPWIRIRKRLRSDVPAFN